MKLRNKKTGEIKDVEPITIGGFRSLAELNEEWEDYEEPKAYYYYIDNADSVMITTDCGFRIDERREELGNYFKTKVEAEQAIERLKAWKRLKDKEFRFNNWAFNGDGANCTDMVFDAKLKRLSALEADEMCEDLDLLFGGEE